MDIRPSLELRSHADIVFTQEKTAVLIDECFWRGCPISATIPKKNSDYWVPKFQSYKELDPERNSKLKPFGWVKLRFWENE